MIIEIEPITWNIFCSSDELHEWYSTKHEKSIKSYIRNIENLLNPASNPLRKAGSVSSKVSATSSARLKLAERKAKQKAEEELEEEVRKFEEEELRIKHRKKELENKMKRKELQYLEQEIESIEGSDCRSNPDSERSHQTNFGRISRTSSPQPTPISLFKEIAGVLKNQNEISSKVARFQQTSNLPKIELKSFDGTDITHFKTFIMNFERIIENQCSNDADKLHYLLQYTSGKAHQLVDSCKHFNSTVAYRKAKGLLTEEYGNEFRVSNCYIEKLNNWPTIKSEDATALQDLSLFLLDCLHYQDNMTYRNQLQSPKELLAIVEKLPYKLQERWRRRCYDLQSNVGSVYFKNLVDFVCDEAAVLNQPLFGTLPSYKPQPKVSEKPKQSYVPRKQLSVQTNEPQTIRNKFCEYCKMDSHFISSCNFFKEITHDKKSEFVKKTNLCFACLKKNHTSKDCRNKATCIICSKRHPTILHYYSNEKKGIYKVNTNKPEKENKPENNVKNEINPQIDETKALSSRDRMAKKKVMVPIVPAKLKINNIEVSVNCALDSCSSDTWLNEKLLKTLKITPKETNINVTTMNGTNDLKTKVVYNSELSDVNGNYKVVVPVMYTKNSNSWPFNRDDLATDIDIADYSYLSEVPFNFTTDDIDVLIGMNVPELFKCEQIIDGEGGGPFASKVLFGWTLNGPVSRSSKLSHCNRINVSNKSEIDDDLAKYFHDDFVDNKIEKAISYNDQRWLNKIETTIKKLPSQHYEIPLPFNDDAYFPNNKSQIFKMFLGLNKRLTNDENLMKDYSEFMTNMIENKFVERVPTSEIECEPGSSWYISHHPVYHKQKCKIRIVFNCSMKFNGVSINDNLSQGPDLTNNLVGVLIRFRQESVAIVGDIQKMFYQVRLPAKDSNYLKFFWFDSNNEIVEYRLRVHVFGATSSPSIANFALKHSVKHLDDNDNTKITVLKNFYVDDMLKSVPNEDIAIDLLNNVKSTISNSKFNLTCINSNSKVVLNSVDKTDLAPGADIYDLCTEPVESRALGVVWNTNKDQFSFNIKILVPMNNVTKRIILRTLASIFDPLGLCSPVLIDAKVIFQETCRLKLDWDDIVPNDLSCTWNKWLKNLKILADYKIPRCLKLPFEVKTIELHTFCDGSEKAYGTAIYLKFIYQNGKKSSSLIASKSRLVPKNNSTLKTVPRIELASAKLAVELSHNVKSELEYKINKETYWSDSTTVLNYIQSDSARFQRYVSNKVCFIRNFTKPSDWKFVSTKENPADLISRGTTPLTLITSDLWNHGPKYLLTSTEPNQDYDKQIQDSDVEIKTKTVLLTNTNCDSPLETMFNSVSSWWKLKLRIASLLNLQHAVRSKQPLKNKIMLEDVKQAEIVIIKYFQEKHFVKEINCIKLKLNLPKCSPLKKLCPFIDNHNILRIGGRINNSASSFDVKHPIVLPACTVTDLLVADIHVTIGHLGRETILNHLRQKYWLIKANTTVRKIVNKCITCKKIHGKPGEQIMSSLPEIRVSGDVPAFFHTGLDCFGPFIVSQGRKTVKRYGIIFTCMSSRAIHIEVADSLSTDSFINGLRRFICRRGSINSITSDNATNFKGANSELKKIINEWNLRTIEKWLKQKNIKWNFNTPYASHHGGVFERLIRSIRQVFSSLLADQKIKLNDDQLNTLMCETESILNQRPLTQLTSDPSDLCALTPNHLLLFNAGVTFPPGLFNNDDMYCRKRYKQVQYLAQQFWVQWKKRYLVLLQERQKWSSIRSDFKINDLVIVVDILLPRNNWPLGRIVEVCKSNDNLIRSVKVKISKSKDNIMSNFDCVIIDRPITKLIKLLECDD